MCGTGPCLPNWFSMLNLVPPGVTHRQGAADSLKEALMTGWRDQMVDRPETDNAAYAAGWTVSGLAVLGAIVAVWVLGI